MITTAHIRDVPHGWLVRFTTETCACPPVIVGDDGIHMYFDPTLPEHDAMRLYQRHRQQIDGYGPVWMLPPAS